MTDNLFDRLAELMQSPGPVNWKMAREVAGSLAGPAQAISPGVAAEFESLTRTAQLHLGQVAWIDLGGTMPEVQVVDRAGWTAANLRSFSYLIDPIAEGFGGGDAGPLAAILKPLGPALLGMQMGSMVGLMSHRVLGQFDVGLPALGRSGLFFVAPNIESFARDHHIDPSQARLWAALHEVTHQAELARPWVLPHFASLVDDYFEGLEFDPTTITSRLEGIDNPAELERLLHEPGGLAGVVAGPEQQEALGRIQAFMAIAEGFAHFLVDRTAPQLIPDTPRIREAVNRRRAEPTQGEEMLQRLVGIEVKRNQYRLGATFCAEIERRWGSDAIGRIWEAPEHLPTLDELDDPVGWAARVLL